MARFSQAFLQGLLQPSYQQGLFEAARNLGQAPGIMRMEQQRQQQLDTIKNITSVSNQGMAAAQAADLGGLNASIKSLQQQAQSAPTVEVANAINDQLTTLQSMVPQTKKMASLNSVNQLEVARQAAKTPEQKREIERIMERVARESGNSTQGILGRTDAEIQTAKTRQEEAITENFYAVPVENRKAYLRGAEEKGFGEIASILEARELEREADQIKIDEARTSVELARTPLPTSGLKKRIESLPDSQEKTDLLDRIEAAESRNIKEGQTFMPGERKRLGDELTSINDGISRAAGRQDQANLIVERQTQDEIQRLQRDLTRIQIDDDRVEEEARRLEKEKGTDFFGTGTTYKDFEAEARENLQRKAAEKIQAAIDRLQGSSTPNESQSAGQSVIEGWSASDYKGKTVTFKDGTYKSDGTTWTKVE